MTFIQQRQFDKDERQDLVVNCIHPGYVQTSATNFQGDKNIEEGQYKYILKVKISNMI